MFVVKYKMNFYPTFLLENENVGFWVRKAVCMCPHFVASLFRVLKWVKSTRHIYEVMGWDRR